MTDLYTTGFDRSFGPFAIFFGILFLIVVGIFVTLAIKGIMQWNKNNHSPVLTVVATVVAKRQEVAHSSDLDSETMNSSSTTYHYVTFQVESGDRMEFLVHGSEYGMLVEGDNGRLTFQGTRYKSFDRMNI